MKPRRIELTIAASLAITVTLGLAVAHRSVGYARDEGVYFEASRRAGAWLSALVRNPAANLKPAVRDRVFDFNHEHPPMMKLAAGASAQLLARAPATGEGSPGRWPLLPEGAAMRLPAQILAGLGAALLYLVGARRGGASVGLLAALGFILLPHVAFHAGLHAFDVPIAVAIFAVALAYRAGLRSRGWGLAVGPMLGLAIAIKHNALFVGPLCALHLWSTLAWARLRHGQRTRITQWLPLPLVSMAVCGPLVAWSCWPWLWHDTIPRLREYLAFHREHNWYNVEFLAHNYNQPPMPVSYPAVMTWATVPSVILLLAIVGIVLMLRRDATEPATAEHTGSFSQPLPEGWCRHDGLWLALFAAFPIALISLPSTPIFGGTKHWITAYPFVALAAAWGWEDLRRAAELPPRVARWAAHGWLLVLLPVAWSTVHGHRHGISQYAPLVGGARGAADLGLQRGFWGYDVLELLPEISGPTYVHDIHELARRQYEREGTWPADAPSVPIERARAALLFHERHMLVYELAIWDALDTTAPTAVITLDDVPITSFYTSQP